MLRRMEASLPPKAKRTRSYGVQVAHAHAVQVVTFQSSRCWRMGRPCALTRVAKLSDGALKWKEDVRNKSVETPVASGDRCKEESSLQIDRDRHSAGVRERMVEAVVSI